MKASRLIELLQEHIRVYGDDDVVVSKRRVIYEGAHEHEPKTDVGSVQTDWFAEPPICVRVFNIFWKAWCPRGGRFVE